MPEIETDSESHVTAPEDRIPLDQKSAYAVGMLVNNLQAAALPAMMVILNLGLKMRAEWVGIIAFAPRIIDAVTDPMMGYISDHTRTRWGRRRPYIFAGAILAGLIFAAMWQLPEGHSEQFYFWVFLSVSFLYFVAYTIYATPFVALGFEMTPDYHERTRLQAFANTVGQLAWIGVPWFYAIMASDRFENTVHGARVLALWVGGTICLLGLFPAVFCREPKTMGGVEPVKDATQANATGIVANLMDFFQGLVTTFNCKPFVKICAATFLVFNGFQLGASFSLYVIQYYLYAGNEKSAGILQGKFGTLTALCTLAVIPLTAWISTKIGKRNTFLITISLSLFGYAIKWFGYNPDHPEWLLFSCPFVAFGTGSLFTLMGSMVADVCDYDELESHERREGVFGAIYWWMVKVGMALAGLLTGYMLLWSNFDVNLETAQPDQTLFLLRVFDVGVPLATSALALFIMFTYELTETRSHEIRAELVARRGKLDD
ncbi:MFS transporter [Adhaeretor mobilis]|uniref:MFS transporter n=1 Tax=Adhaeretor mobilis TaxID=1930276 RepID=A0A517MYL4_9BACT|nr:MFS transporter [Adhaeretor mobilis]QDS99907.1 hypothetical protein HG15A2_32380 [Adhaeretor mobilis]